MDWNRWVEEAARAGRDPVESWDRAVNLGGNTLGGADAGLVGKYWAITGGSRNEEWIRANPSEFWQRQLRDAQNFFNNSMQHYGNVRADVLRKEQEAKSAELKRFQEQQQAQAQAATQQAQAQFQAQQAQVAAQQAASTQQLQVVQQQAAQAAAQQEQQRAAEEKMSAAELSRLAAQEQATIQQKRLAEEAQQRESRWGSFLGGYNLDTKDYSGVQAQAEGYKSFLSGQLGAAEFNPFPLLKGYDSTGAINQVRTITGNFDTYKASLDPWVKRHGGHDEIAAKASEVQKQASLQTSAYDQQIQNQLQQLGQVYQSYGALGDITRSEGATGQERVMSLFGFRQPDVKPVEEAFTGLGSAYEQRAKELVALYGGEGQPGGLYQQKMDAWGGVANQFNPAVQGLLSTYGNASNVLHSMYGNVQDVLTGRISGEAQRQAGLVTERSGILSGVLGQAQQQKSALVNTYNETANRLRTNRIAEGQQIREQRPQQEFADRQNRLMTLAATTLQKPAERTRLALRRTNDDTQQQDPLGLSRGYTSLLGGF